LVKLLVVGEQAVFLLPKIIKYLFKVIPLLLVLVELVIQEVVLLKETMVTILLLMV